jgi:hypothetical protein
LRRILSSAGEGEAADTHRHTSRAVGRLSRDEGAESSREAMEGSSEMNTYIDSSVGGLVWVRRRNGSWWPGRILGAEELPGSHLLSPRTGTPVKLLGREDGSV